MRIFRHWEEINTRKRFNTQQQNNKTAVNDDSHNSGDANTLSSDYGMKDAKGKAEQLLRQRIHSRGAENGGGARAAQITMAEMPIIKNNLYKIDAWVQPFADVKTLH